MKPPLLLVVTNMARGGAETQVCRMALELRRRQWPVSVVSLLPPTAYQDELASGGVPLYTLDMRPGIPNPRAFLRWMALLARLRPTIVHAHMFHAILLARMARCAAPLPVLISTVHSVVESSRRSETARLRELALRLTDWLNDLTVTVCRHAAERYARLRIASPARLRVLYNGVDPSLYRPDSRQRAAIRSQLGLGDEFVWLAVGRLMWKKDYPTLLRAFARSSSGVLLIAGDGPQRMELEKLAAQDGIRARFLGARDDVPQLLSAADAFVMSSVVEGLPLVLLEASACGLPCVATRAGGIPEAVEDGVTGLLVPVSDAAQLAAAIGKLEAMPAEQRKRMGDAARHLAVTRFSLPAIVSQWEAIYDELSAKPL